MPNLKKVSGFAYPFLSKSVIFFSHEVMGSRPDPTMTDLSRRKRDTCFGIMALDILRGVV